MNLRPNWGKTLSVWLAAFLTAGILLFFYAGVPLAPILLGGLLVLGITLFRLRRRG
jgi:hypothetical protein